MRWDIACVFPQKQSFCHFVYLVSHPIILCWFNHIKTRWVTSACNITQHLSLKTAREHFNANYNFSLLVKNTCASLKIAEIGKEQRQKPSPSRSHQSKRMINILGFCGKETPYIQGQKISFCSNITIFYYLCTRLFLEKWSDMWNVLI